MKGHIRPSYALGCMLISALVSWICFDSFWPGAAGILLIPAFSNFVTEQKERRRGKLLNAELKRMMTMLYSSTAAGSTLEKAFRETMKEMEADAGAYKIMLPEVTRLCLGLDHHQSMDQVLAAFADHCMNDDVTHLTRVLGAAEKTGGSLPRILWNTSESIALRMEVDEEIGVMLAGRKSELRIMMVIPAAILVYMRFSSPAYASVLYESMAGHLVMSACLGLYALAVMTGRKILDIRV